MEYIQLGGTEQVQRAAREMAGAAERMEQTYGWLDETLRRFILDLEGLVCRLEALAPLPSPEPADPEGTSDE